jgi:hypothetical protein
MTRIERVAYSFAAVLCLVFGFGFFELIQTRMEDGTSDRSVAIFVIGGLLGCMYFARKAWVGKRKLPEGR